MITREQVADLQPGDVVEISGYPMMHGAKTVGPVWAGGGQKLCVGPFILRHRDGTPPHQFEDDDDFTLTVVSRAPRKFYVNHPRTEPVPGDVVRDADSSDAKVWLAGRNYDDEPCWIDAWRMANPVSNPIPRRLRLLVDGETGEVVQ